MHDQADELRALVMRHAGASEPNRADAAPRLIAVASGKGGVGNTTLATNLAIALGLRGKRVVLVDADLNRAGVASLCGLQADASISDVLSGSRTIHEVLLRGPAGIHVVPGAWGRAGLEQCTPAGQERLIAALRSMGRHAEYVILDVGSGINRVVRTFWSEADSLVVPTTAEPQSLLDTYATIKVLWELLVEPRLDVVVNMARDAQTAIHAHRRLAKACQRFLGVHAEAAGWIPWDSRLASSGVKDQVLNHAAHGPWGCRTDTREAFDRVAQHLAATLVKRDKVRNKRTGATHLQTSDLACSAGI